MRCRSYGAWEINAIQTYKHLAPLALKTVQAYSKHRLGITHTLHITPFLTFEALLILYHIISVMRRRLKRRYK